MVSRKGLVWKFFALIFLLKICQGIATEYKPWLGNLYEFESRSSLRYQRFHWFSSGSHLQKFSSNDFFLNVSLSNARPDFGVEFEVLQASTRRQKGDIDRLRINGKYVWLDDVAGDPWTVTTGLSFIQAFRHSLKDLGSFHHGMEEGELFLSVGKETACETVWSSRWWGILGIGIAERGSPWIRFNLHYEKGWCDRHETKLFMHSMCGLGNKRLPVRHFHGYGPIRHQSIDIGFRYTYLLEFFGSVSLEYSYRVYAQNFPIYAHQVLGQLLYTFGL
jgi:hypothetical protein